jgi:hypothetical protein
MLIRIHTVSKLYNWDLIHWIKKYDEQDQQEKTAFDEGNLKTTQQQEPAVRSPGGPHKKQDRAHREHGQDNHVNVINNRPTK